MLRKSFGIKEVTIPNIRFIASGWKKNCNQMTGEMAKHLPSIICSFYSMKVRKKIVDTHPILLFCNSSSSTLLIATKIFFSLLHLWVDTSISESNPYERLMVGSINNSITTSNRRRKTAENRKANSINFILPFLA